MRTTKITGIARAIAAIVHVVLLAPLLAWSLSTTAQAQENLRLAEYAIKVGLLYNFLHYTEWPDGAQASAGYTVCVYGEDPFGGRLALMAERTVNRHAITVAQVSDTTAARECSLVFVNAAEREQWPRLRAALASGGVLTVSDFDGFVAAGGMIEFTRVRDRIGVRINTHAVSAAGLSVGDRMLRLADLSRAQR